MNSFALMCLDVPCIFIINLLLLLFIRFGINYYYALDDLATFGFDGADTEFIADSNADGFHDSFMQK